MINFVLKKIFGTKSERDLKKTLPLVNRVTELEEEYQKLYGYLLNTPIRVVNIRLVARVPSKRVAPRTSTEVVISVQRVNSSRKAYWGDKHGTIDTPV